MTTSPHIPIMVNECLEFLSLEQNDCVIDGTLGFGGHSEAILNQLGQNGSIIGLDQDKDAINFCKNKFKNDNRIHCIQDNASNFNVALKRLEQTSFQKFFMDLGLSSYQLDHPDRGFSYSRNAPLDMKMNQSAQKSASDILNTYEENELHLLFTDHSDLRCPPKFIDNIIKKRRKSPFSTTDELITSIKQSFYFKNSRRLYLKICAQVFQSLRIEVNQELTRLNQILEKINTHLPTNGRAVFLTFHSIEDRIIKHFFQARKNTFKKITKHVVKPTQDEIKKNSRSKPAKLRGYIKKE